METQRPMANAEREKQKTKSCYLIIRFTSLILKDKKRPAVTLYHCALRSSNILLLLIGCYNNHYHDDP